MGTKPKIQGKDFPEMWRLLQQQGGGMFKKHKGGNYSCIATQIRQQFWLALMCTFAHKDTPHNNSLKMCNKINVELLENDTHDVCYKTFVKHFLKSAHVASAL